MAKDFKIVHIAGPSDKLQTGCADYADRLAENQRAHGMDAVYLSNNPHEPAKGRLNITWADPKAHGIDFKKLHEGDQPNRLRAWQGVNEAMLGEYAAAQRAEGKEVIWHLSLAYPHSGAVVSPEWLEKQPHTTATVRI